MYPVTYSADIPIEGRNRLSTFFRYIYAIPAVIVSFLFAIGAELAAYAAWFAIALTGRYPEGLYGFNVKALRMIARVNSYTYLLTDEYPPFNGEEDPSHPVQVRVAERLDSYSRSKAIFRLIVGIPVFVINYVWQTIGAVVGIVAWFAIVFTGKMPDGLIRPLRSSFAYQTKALAYFLLMTEDWPPFEDPEDVVPAGQIAESKSQTPA